MRFEDFVAGDILIIEDDEPVRTVFARALRAAGHTVDEASDGVEGAEAIRRTAYSVVLLDLRLPRMTGYDILKSLPPDITPTIVILSASPDDVRKVSGDRRVMMAVNKTFALQNLEPVVAAVSAVAKARSETLL